MFVSLFRLPPSPPPPSGFGVFQVEYHVETFCDKNKDELPKESDELFASSENPFVTNLFAPAGGERSQSENKTPTPPPLFVNHLGLQMDKETKYIDKNGIGHTQHPGPPGRGCVQRATVGAIRRTHAPRSDTTDGNVKS